MLRHLYIRNFTLISELSIDFHPGFSVITGETGAGKSIIVGAIALITGNRADAKYIKKGSDKCIVEAHFDISQYGLQQLFNDNDIDYDADDCILRREISSSGKSRAFINDTPASLAQLRALGEKLIDIHSQHQNLMLRQENFQLSVVDIIANNQQLLNDYNDAYQQLITTRRQLEKLKAEIRESKNNEDFMRFQLDELQRANLQRDEQESLEQTVESLSHVEEIKSSLFDAASTLLGEEHNATQMVREAAQALHSIDNIFPDALTWAERLDSTYIELKDIAQEVSHATTAVDFEPARLQQLRARLDNIYSLEQKHHVDDVNKLIDLQNELKHKVDAIDDSETVVQEQEQLVQQAEKHCQAIADKLSAQRKKAAKKIEQELQSRLAPLGIPHVRFEVQMTNKELSADGSDAVAFLFSANTSTAPEPITQVASGGEIARVMLSLKAMISAAVSLPTIIFDEIDTGVSGRVAEKMAQIMHNMGANKRQVISITHLPQIAALGEHHYKVEKEEAENGTTTRMIVLNDEQRVNEIAQMLSGSNITEAAITNAKALLGNKQ